MSSIIKHITITFYQLNILGWKVKSAPWGWTWTFHSGLSTNIQLKANVYLLFILSLNVVFLNSTSIFWSLWKFFFIYHFVFSSWYDIKVIYWKICIFIMLVKDLNKIDVKWYIFFTQIRVVYIGNFEPLMLVDWIRYTKSELDLFLYTRNL